MLSEFKHYNIKNTKGRFSKICKMFFKITFTGYICFIYFIKIQSFIPVMAKQNFQHHYSSLQCHMIRICWFAAQETIFLNIYLVFF